MIIGLLVAHTADGYIGSSVETRALATFVSFAIILVVAALWNGRRR